MQIDNARITTLPGRTRAATSAEPETPRIRKPFEPHPGNREKTAAGRIIDAEYVDVYSPVRPHGGLESHFNDLIIEPHSEQVTTLQGDTRQSRKVMEQYTRQAAGNRSPAGTYIDLFA